MLIQIQSSSMIRDFGDSVFPLVLLQKQPRAMKFGSRSENFEGVQCCGPISKECQYGTASMPTVGKRMLLLCHWKFLLWSLHHPKLQPQKLSLNPS